MPGDVHLRFGASSGAGLQAAGRAVEPEELSSPKCKALISGERQRQRASESLQSWKESKILGVFSVEGQGTSPSGLGTFLPSPPSCAPAWRRSPTFKHALGAGDPGCSAGRQQASGLTPPAAAAAAAAAATPAAKRGAREFEKRHPLPLTR